MEDNQIVELYWARSERAITETASKYGTYCYAIANNILQNAEDAEECVNDTYLGAWNAMPPHCPSILRTFLGKLIRRISLKKQRDQTRDKRGGGEVALAFDELEECVPANAAVEEDVIAAELPQILNRFVAGLPRQRHCQRTFSQAGNVLDADNSFHGISSFFDSLSKKLLLQHSQIDSFLWGQIFLSKRILNAPFVP